MAIAKQSAGVTIGYKPKPKQVESRKPTRLQRMAVSVRANAREMSAFAADEIVYAMMDTMRLLKYLRYEFGFAGMRRRTADGGSRMELSRDAAPVYTNFFELDKLAVEPAYSEQR